jgi:hypothetical protein
VAPLKLASDQECNNTLSQMTYLTGTERDTVEPANAQLKTLAQLDSRQRASLAFPRFLARSTSVLTRPQSLLATRRFA